MLILIAITAFSYLFVLYAKRLSYAGLGSFDNRLPHPLGFFLPALLFTVFSGLRSGIGDTFFTMHAYRQLPENIVAPRLFEKEYLYCFLTYALRKFSDNPQYLILMGALFFCPAAVYFLYKNALHFELAIFLFVAGGYYTFSFNGMRQYMAAGILLLGSKYLLTEEKNAALKYAAFVLLASSLHTSALIMLPIFFLVRRKSFSLPVLAVVFASLLSLILLDIFLPQFLSFLSLMDYGIYKESGWFTSGQESGASFLRVSVAALPFGLSALVRKRLKVLGFKGAVLVNLSALNLAFYILSLYNWIFARLAIYTEAHNIVLITWLVSLAFKKRDRKLAYLLCILFYALFFIGISYSVKEYRSDFFRTVF